MRAADILGAEVVGPDGARLGMVLDVRLVQDGPMLGADCALRIDGFVVGRRWLASHLGYDRANVNGPALVNAIVQRLCAGNRYLPWDHVAQLAPGHVECGVSQLGPVPMLVDGQVKG
ncbi:MAG: hypothetical protein JWO88_1304 [Frankiales bacterium]|nr:hypothetical protein [Frankiales bacterium]